MFRSEYHYSIDAKGRMTIPVRFRELLADGVYITRGFDQNLKLLTDPAFEAMAEKINGLSETNPKARKLRRFFYSSADRLDIDRLGRVLIPQFLRDFAGLEKEAVIVGVGDAIEIWSPEAWQEEIEDLNDAQVSAQEFAELDL